MKKHWNTGNKYAAKDETLDARLAFRCTKEEREYVTKKVASEEEEAGSVTAYLRKLIDKDRRNETKD